MTMENDNWFIEHFDSEGTAFGLRLKRKLEKVESPYQVIEMWETDTFGYLMTIDGATMVTSRDNFLYHEMMTHPALYTHAAPKRVAIIGGGDCGTLREVLRHDEVEQAWQIDIDEEVTRLSEKYFPELCEANSDPRAELLFLDGLKWMDEREPGSLDVIIVDSTDPVGHAAGLFQTDFFRQCHRVLAEGGLIVQQSESPLLHAGSIIRDLHHSMREAGFTDTRTLAFPQPVYPSGWWSCTLAGKGVDLTRFREQDVAAAQLPTRYYSAPIHQSALVMPPFMAAALD
jgi:spermidine synthase